jgi:ferredoxin
MSWFKSLAYSLKESRYNPITGLHASAYAATVTYLRLLKNLARLNSPVLRATISESYHSKVLRLEDARKIITINADIELRNLDQVLPYRHAKDLILKNPGNIAVYECPCRAQQEAPCQPTEVCLVIGEPFVDLIRLFQPFRSRRISIEEALRILREEDERGHVHTAWFKSAMLDRFYAICNCCKCCCLGMKFMAEHQMKMLLPSGYRAVIDEGCIGCGLCARHCQFEALEICTVAEEGQMRKSCRVVDEKCFGCGICVRQCQRGAIALVLDPAKGIPLDIDQLLRAPS